ncbi:BfmA/BtgA family mobilization protein [Tunicatimonas pelagia]|uniref:BfmA/BtgA family mobilization protein n=1 Tax=Tunicatimonas pelagia TaxID=931531 RepID=UPI002666703C|nr:BfmA/BtgA family mobilization protein [Tunicatimonas pelagia]WKN46471.1 BfmA/BtgA family mobilization protein [Tunicatimonas pelagia]
MTKRKPLQINSALHAKYGAEAKNHRMTLKKYAEASMGFFANRGINPLEYSPGQSFDLLQVMKKSTDRIISYIVHQEQTLLSDLTEEVIRNRLYQDALLILLLEVAVEPNQREERMREISTYVEQKIKEAKA